MSALTPKEKEALQLLNAVRLGEVVRIKRLLDEGMSADTANVMGKTALMISAHEGLPDTMELLLSRGARVDLASEGGDTALHWAVEVNDIAPDAKCIDLLVEAGAGVDTKNHLGHTPALKCALAAVEHHDRYGQPGDYHLALEALMVHGADMSGVRDIILQHPGAFVEGKGEQLMAWLDGDTLQAQTAAATRSVATRRI